MNCPDCGYMMSAFDKSCPRCTLYLKKPKQAPPAEAWPTQSPLPIVQPQYVPQDLTQMISAQPGKVCPKCNRIAEIERRACENCGHEYRTVFPPSQSSQSTSSQQTYPPQVQAPSSYSPVPQPPSYPAQMPMAAPAYGQMLPPGTVQLPAGMHNVAVAVILALFMNGAGQMVNKQIGKGFVILLTAVFLGVSTLGIGWLVVSIFGLADAVCIAQRLNRGEPVRAWQWF